MPRGRYLVNGSICISHRWRGATGRWRGNLTVGSLLPRLLSDRWQQSVTATCSHLSHKMLPKGHENWLAMLTKDLVRHAQAKTEITIQQELELLRPKFTYKFCVTIWKVCPHVNMLPGTICNINRDKGCTSHYRVFLLMNYLFNYFPFLDWLYLYKLKSWIIQMREGSMK